MAHYLVTGGGGFIGSNIVERLLADGQAVRVLDNFLTGRRENLEPFLSSIELIEGDIRNPEDCARAVDGVDYVLHEAAVPSVPRSLKDPLLSNEINVTGTLRLLMAARDAKVKRLVFASSSSVYGNQDAEWKREDLVLAPLSPYAANKAVGEYYLQAFSNCFGLETIALRYFNVFGPRQDPDSPYSAVIPLFINAMLEGRKPTVHGDGMQSRDFTFVENVARANILAATAPCRGCGQAYNVACGTSFTLLDLVSGINEALGTGIAPEHTDARLGDVRFSKADIGRAQRDLGYDVTIPFVEGLRRTVAWYRKEAHRDA